MLLAQQVQAHDGLCGPQVRDALTVALDLQQAGVGLLEGRERDGGDVGQRQAVEHVPRAVVCAEHEQAEVLLDLRQRPVQSEGPRKVRGVHDRAQRQALHGPRHRSGLRVIARVAPVGVPGPSCDASGISASRVRRAGRPHQQRCGSPRSPFRGIAVA